MENAAVQAQELRFADLHAHYPMQVAGKGQLDGHLPLASVLRPPTARDKLRAFGLWIASRLFSHSDPDSGYRVTAETLVQGNACLAMSVLMRTDDEVDLGEPWMSEPESRYFDHIVRELEQVEQEVSTHDPAHLRLVRNGAELKAWLTAQEGPRWGRRWREPPSAPPIALAHCIEGGFSLGNRPSAIERNVATLAERGVAYITLAHLLYRQVAANAPAIPFIPDGVYEKLFRQPTNKDQAGRTGLTNLGVAAVTAMVEHGVMVDISHMREDAIDETWQIMRELDPEATVPMIATHAGYRFGEQKYMLSKDTLLMIKERGGVVGLIMAQHQLCDGLGEKTETPQDSLEALHAHIDRIREITGASIDHVALGTDFDGFIKPTLTGFESSSDLPGLSASLVQSYGLPGAKKIASENAIRVLKKLWRVA